MKKLVLILLSIIMLFSLAACGTDAAPAIEPGQVLEMQWQDIDAAAAGTTVNLYGWGGDDKVNAYIDTIVADKLLAEYNITLNRVGMDIQEILTRMLAEKDAESGGTIDIVWLNGENFYTAKQNDLLLGSFLENLPNSANLDLNDMALNHDFGIPTEGMEAPWGRAQLVFFADTSQHQMPQDLDELKAWIAENPGQFTYPAPPEFTGSAFVRNIIMQMIDPTLLLNGDLTKEELREIIAPAIAYLNEIKPNLWREGTTYPANFAQLSNMYADGEIAFGMTYTVDGVNKAVAEGLYPAQTEVFTLAKGGISNTHYLTIPANAPNAAGAMMVINELLSVEMQAAKADSANWGDLPVLALENLSAEDQELLADVEYAGPTLPEANAKLVMMIDEIWLEEVL